MSRVLIVDDESDARLLHGKRLQAAGYEVLVANNGWEALLVLNNPKQPADLILLDILMPGLDGIQFLEVVRRTEKLRHIPVLMVTCLDIHDAQSKLHSLSVQGIVVKRAEYLKRTLEQVDQITGSSGDTPSGGSAGN